MNTINKTYSPYSIQSMRAVLKNSLRGYTRVTNQILHTLEQLGFEIRRASNHYILTTHTSNYSDKVPDRILVFSLSKTPSDKRAGLNIASTICNTIEQYL